MEGIEPAQFDFEIRARHKYDDALRRGRLTRWALASQLFMTAAWSIAMPARASLATDYVFAEGDATKRFNTTSQGGADVQHASRSIFYLKPDTIVVYDRAASKSVNRYKKFFLNFQTQPQIFGNMAVVTTPKGQKVYVNKLLPAAGTMSWDMPTTTWSYNERTED